MLSSSLQGQVRALVLTTSLGFKIQIKSPSLFWDQDYGMAPWDSGMELDFPRVKNPDTASGRTKLEKKGFPIESRAHQAIACSLAQAIKVKDVLKTQCRQRTVYIIFFFKF